MSFFDFEKQPIRSFFCTAFLVVVPEFFWKLFEHAILNWIDDKIAEKLKIVSPSAQLVVDFLIKWGVPIIILVLVTIIAFILGKRSVKPSHTTPSCHPPQSSDRPMFEARTEGKISARNSQLPSHLPFTLARAETGGQINMDGVTFVVGKNEQGSSDPVRNAMMESLHQKQRVALGLEVNPKALQIEIGESGPFMATGRGNIPLYSIKRTFSIKIENVDKRRPIAGCKIYVMSIDPQEYVGPWLLKDSFDLAAGEHIFVPLVTYGEARDISKTPAGDTFMTIHALQATPKPSSGTKHLVTLRATSRDTAPCELQCSLWVNDVGRLKIEKVRIP